MGSARASGWRWLSGAEIAAGALPANGREDFADALRRRVEQVARGASLTPRECEVLELLLLGRNMTEIGTTLGITPRTVRFHQSNVLEKIGADSRFDLLRALL